MSSPSYRDYYRDEHGVKRVKFFHQSSEPPQVHTEDSQEVHTSKAFKVPLSTKQWTSHGVESSVLPETANFRKSLEAVVGPVNDHQVISLLTKSKGDVQTAINLFFDSTQTSDGDADIAIEPQAAGKQLPEVSQQNQANHSFTERHTDSSTDDIVTIHRSKSPPPAPRSSSNVSPTSLGLYKNWSKRFMGSFQAEIWATRSGRNFAQYEERLQIKRDYANPANILQAGNYSKEDYIVRVVNSKGEDFARLGEADAKIVSVLIDTRVCHFTATTIYAPDWVQIGDYMIIQINVFLLPTAFVKDIVPPSEYPNSGYAALGKRPMSGKKKSMAMFDNSRENVDEKIMRMRQLGITKLFAKLGMIEVSSEAVESGDMPSQTSTNSDEDDGQQVDQDQLDYLYKRAEPPDTQLEPYDPPDTFKLTLRPYQKKGLRWMIQKETPEEDLQTDDSDEPINPLWQSIVWPSQLELASDELDPQDSGAKSKPEPSSCFYVNAYSGELSLEFPRQKKTVLGGILADEMGLGKTISTMSLIHSNPYKSRGEQQPPNFAFKTTLVVAPMSLLAQWESEVHHSSQPGSMKVLVYYGIDAAVDVRKLLCQSSEPPDIMITSYGTLLSEYSRLVEFRKQAENKIDSDWREDPTLQLFGLYSVKFYRIVLDEAHNIKNRNTKTSKACYDLEAEKRWVLTGTPIVNKLEDLYSLIKFLRVEPWNEFSFWKAFITTPFQSKGYVKALKVVQSVMEPLVLRRTKDMKQADGTPLVQLPAKTITIQKIKFSDDEKDLYSWIFAKVRSSFDKSLTKGSVMKSYTAILTQIMRLRQACCHPSLVWQMSRFDAEQDEDIAGASDISNMLELEDKDMKETLARFESSKEPEEERELSSYNIEVIKNIIDGSAHECAICTTEPIPVENQAVTGCFHVSCLTCLLEHIEFQENKGETPRCHTCRETISKNNIFQVVRKHSADGSENVTLKRYRKSNQSVKVTALVHDLRINQDGAKAVVFSQFTSFLNIIQEELLRQGFDTLRFDGTMSQRARAETLEQFSSSKKATVLLISLKAGGVGLNLVCARHVYMMDPWWSYAIESQAIDRIHRMGQISDVRVIRFIVEGTVEERMLKIQDRKKFLASTLGMSEAERKAQRLDDIKMLFEE